MPRAVASRFDTLGRARKAQLRELSGPRDGQTQGRNAAGLSAAAAPAPLGNTYEQVSAAKSRSLQVGRPVQTARRPASRPAVVPRYVQRCGCDALYTWAKADPSRVSRRPLLCGSWRHAGSCARYSASVAFARMKQAFTPLDPTGNVFLVLTLDQNGVYSERRWSGPDEANAELSRQSRNFLKRLRRYCVTRGWRDFRSQWVAVVESHRTGWPHINFVIHCPELALELEQSRERRLAAGATKRNATLLEGELLDIAMSTGWGAQSIGERGRSADALASYIAKIAGNADATMGELAKLSQSPVSARKGFRRLRAGKGFLPPKRVNDDYTGTLIRRLPDARLTAYQAVPLVQLRDPVARAVSVLLLEVEEQRMAREWRWRQPLKLNEQRPPLPVRESYELRGGRYALLSLTPESDGERPALCSAKPDADRTPFVLAPDARTAPHPPAPSPEQVQRVPQSQLVLAYAEPVFELRRAHEHVDPEHARRFAVDRVGDLHGPARPSALVDD